MHTRPEDRPDWQVEATRWRIRDDVPKGWQRCVPVIRVRALSHVQ